MDAARAYGATHAESADWASAVDGYATAARLLPTVAGLELGTSSREASLREWAGLASDCAASLLSADRTERAVEALELGRAVLWSQQLTLRSDAARLNDRAPALAARLRAVQALLDRRAADLPELIAATSPGR
jgi:hypothetical protein